jgi:hypothetical protein
MIKNVSKVVSSPFFSVLVVFYIEFVVSR